MGKDDRTKRIAQAQRTPVPYIRILLILPYKKSIRVVSCNVQTCFRSEVRVMIGKNRKVERPAWCWSTSEEFSSFGART